jgi:hypothetical protein
MKAAADNPSGRGSQGWRFVRNVVIKASVLFFLLNLGFAWFDPLEKLGQLSAYNVIFPGRSRLPFGEDSARSYNLTISQLGAMMAAHEIEAEPKPPDEYRVLLLGDSSVWGFLLEPDQTISAKVNAANLKSLEGKTIRVYNLGYPTLSLTKDLLLLEFAMQHDPDLVVWFFTLDSFLKEKQLDSPLLQHNPGPTRKLIGEYQLGLDPKDARFKERSLMDRTLVGSRQELADLLRLQLYAVLWTATGVDHDVPEDLAGRIPELTKDPAYHDFEPGELSREDLAFEVLEAGIGRVGEGRLLFINEPILIGTGENSQVRYNEGYPRWAYDSFRQMMAETASAQRWHYLDLWDFVPPGAFTDSAIHYSPDAVEQVAGRVSQAIVELANEAGR